jgi:ABC-2 type transport system ATP-binding protein
MNDVFCVQGLWKRFGRREVLRGVDLRVEPGAVTVLLGENGAGKSTLLRLAQGSLKANAGTLVVLGRDPVREPAAVRRGLGFVPDVPDAPEWMTPQDFLRFLAPHYPTFDRAHVTLLAEKLRVPMTTRFRALSRGEGMKAMLVAALAHQPPLLLLDEPFAGLDPLAREEVLAGVVDALRGQQRTVLCTTHDLDVAARIADRVAILAHGRIAAHGTVGQVLGREEPARIPEALRDALAEAVR